MPEDNNQTQQEDFMPMEKPNIWQRFLFWISSLTPKHKKFLALILVLAVAVIAAIIYFTIAAGEPSFNFEATVSPLEQNKESRINVVVKAGNVDIKTLDMVINYNPSEVDIEVDMSSFQQLNEAGIKVLSDLITNDKVNGIIKIVKDPAYMASFINGDTAFRANNFIAHGEEKIIISLFATPFNTGTLNLDFSVIVNDNQVFNSSHPGQIDDSLNPILPPYLVLNNAAFNVLPPVSANSLYLDPSNANGFNGTAQSLYVGDEFDVNLMLKAGEDLVAVAVDVNYDNNVLSLDLKKGVSVSDDFPVQGEESTISEANINGVYKLVRGYHGDGSISNGNNGQIWKVATLRFKAIGATDKADVILNNKVGVKDDGQGTSVNLASVQNPDYRNPDGTYVDGRYKIIESPPFVAQVVITKGPEVHVKKVSGIWQAEVYWETNVEANEQVIYDGEDNSGNFSLDSSASRMPTTPGTTLSKQHKIILTNLIEGATYRYQIVSQDANGNEVRDKAWPVNDKRHHQFIVQETESKLTIKNLSARASYNSAVISWNTVGGDNNGLANAAVTSCSPAPSAGLPTDLSNYSLSHSLSVNGLNNDTEYTCDVRSTDQASPSGVATGSVTFRTKAGQAPDANVVLKVEPNRICDKWLYCRSSVEVVNSKDEKENLCFDIGLCNEKNSDGECVAVSDLSAIGITAAEQTFKHPTNVSQIQNLSGYSKVGMDWGPGKIIIGNYNPGVMQPLGVDINLVNGDFETGVSWPWVAASNAELSVINKDNNHVLKIKPQIPANANLPNTNLWMSAEAPLGFISREPGYDYAISMSIWSASAIARDIDIELKVAAAYYTIAKVTITSAPQTIVLTSNQKGSQFAYGPQSGQGALAIGDEYDTNKSGYFSDDIYVDNVSLKSILPINSQTKVARSCRLYPALGAIACDTVDANGKVQRGWRGFCMEWDPKYPNNDQDKKLCLNWWPVDIIPGETDVFGKDNQAGYMNRQPLYYCMEAAGNYPYVRQTRSGTKGDGYAPALMYRYCDNKGGITGAIIGWEVYGPIGAYLGANMNTGGKHPCGWGRASGKWTSLAPEEIGWNDIDIERILLEPLCEEGNDDEDCFSKKTNDDAIIILNRSNNWQGFMCNGTNCHNADYYFNPSNHFWDSNPSMLNNNDLCGNQGVDLFAVRAVFDDEGEFKGLESGLCNGAGGDTGFVRYRATFYLRESCNVIAQVVTPDGENMAWASKVKRGGWLKDSNDNYLGYEYNTDYEPYGASVVGAPAVDPTAWYNPLYVMPLDDSLGYEAPYQVRAGSPYGANGTAGQEKIGKAQCISGDAENLGAQCSSSSDCGFSLDTGNKGLCMGINLSDKAKENIYGGYDTGEKNLRNLFAKSYRVWKWAKRSDGTLGYVEVINQTEGFGWDISPENRFVSTKPEVFNIKVQGQMGNATNPVTVNITGPKRIKLEFNSRVNADHLPLTAFRVDWDDGTPISQVNNLKIEAKSDTNNPHVLFHAYEYHKPTDPYPGGGTETYASHGCTATECSYVPKIQVEDNWGWCNNGYYNNSRDYDKCPDKSVSEHPWQAFGGSVIVQ